MRCGGALSKTDNTRPWKIQGRDLTEEGYVNHICTKARGRRSRRHGKWRTSVNVSVSLESWQQYHQVAELFFRFSLPRERDGRVHVSVAKRHNTTAAKVLRQLQTAFDDVELHISQWTEPGRVTLECGSETCTRNLYHTGGERYLGGAACIESKFRRRRIRQCERVAMHRVLAGEKEDFDILPIREDKRTIHYDLS
jgi:hypothetical protein